MDFFRDDIVQDNVRSFFINSIEHDHLAHAYLFYGNEGTGKDAFALTLAKTLNCESEEQKPCNQCASCIKINKLNHPDIRIVLPHSRQTSPDELASALKAKAENPYSSVAISGQKNIPIEIIRELKNEAKYAPFEAKKRVFIIHCAEYFSREAANSFLKLLEEPPADLMIILTSNDKNALLDTILSRCQPVYFPNFNDDQIAGIVNRFDQTERDLKPLIRIAQNNISDVFTNLHSDDADVQRNWVYTFLRTVAAGNNLETSKLIDEITRSRDKSRVLTGIKLIILWLRDAFHYNLLGELTEFVNTDYEDAIKKFAAYYQDSNFNLLIEFADKAYRDVERNMHPSLLLTKLAIDLGENLVRANLTKEVNQV